ncbi:MAG: 4Fe-4S dicluster domain-containing protein [Thermodesulfobacteriota bacterium]
MIGNAVKIILGNPHPQSFWAQKIEALSGQKLFACYQCGKCSSGCPMAESMDLLPNRVIREAQLNNAAALMSCRAVWFCSSCFACAVRCPKGIDIARIMEAVRTLQMMDGKPATEQPSCKDTGTLPQIALISHFRKFNM